MNLPKSHKPFIDKYFLRTNEILKGEGLNPFVRAQVFIRKGPGQVHGIDEAVAILEKYSNLQNNGGRVFAKNEGDHYNSKETLMVIEARIQDIVELETMYLGVLSAETTKANDKTQIDLEQVTRNAEAVVAAAEGRPVSYFGARHWRWDEDAAIARAAYDGGFLTCSTDAGAETYGSVGMGTIPHALENVMAWKFGYENAVVEATLAFDRHTDPKVPRIALVDYANKEISDSVATAEALGSKLFGVRIDTCGENQAEGVVYPNNVGKKFWYGNGVTIAGVNEVRRALNKAGREDVKIILSSGFGNIEKVKSFVDAEKFYGMKLFDALGVGSVYKARFATMDVVAVGETIDSMIPMAKVGRTYNPNPNLKLVLGGM